MKYLIVAIFIMTLGCDSEEEAQGDAITGTWKLSEVVSGWTNEVTPADKLDYAEFYDFKANGKVKKYRSDGKSVEGTYTVEEKSDGTYIEVEYTDVNNELKESCGGNEFLRIEENQLKGGSLPCDGPGLTYVKAGKATD
ncbi:hypothetical protein E1176_16415 [Fulvivirga sp. RKSG066]|uniref:hypothetical protein n=1 Tax=Fulvivirga aurantia TaxID=2529383 RepID=UPI0012BD48EF|nr:hypothetical protein [Fulvivirga aurantia]MTI22617.1 hypothetical protein [Fulvivirga aurantia]